MGTITTGTDKQIAYAEDIIRLTVAQADEMDAKFATAGASDDFRRIARATIDDMIAEHTDAKWWLDRGAAVPSMGIKAHGIIDATVRAQIKANLSAAGIAR